MPSRARVNLSQATKPQSITGTSMARRNSPTTQLPLRFDSCTTHSRTLLPEALAYMPFGFVLGLIRLRGNSANDSSWEWRKQKFFGQKKDYYKKIPDRNKFKI
jgi:hypothetical protein